MNTLNEMRTALEREKENLEERYANQLRSLKERVERATERLSFDRVGQSPISDHDPHNMAANLHELSVLAGRHAVVTSLLRELPKEESKDDAPTLDTTKIA